MHSQQISEIKLHFNIFILMLTNNELYISMRYFARTYMMLVNAKYNTPTTKRHIT